MIAFLLVLQHGAQDIFRKYPNRYESIISALCENLDTLDEPEAKVRPPPPSHPPPYGTLSWSRTARSRRKVWLNYFQSGIGSPGLHVDTKTPKQLGMD